MGAQGVGRAREEVTLRDEEQFRIRFCTALVLLSSGLSGVAFGQPVFATYDSIELRVSQADFVFCGTVMSCKGDFIEKQGGFFGGYRADGSRRPDGVMRYTISVKVDELIKGSPLKTIELVQETLPDDKRFEQWEEHHTSFLWFGGGREWSNLGGMGTQPNPLRWNTIRLGNAVPAESTFSSDHPIYAMDFRCLTDVKEILACVRKAVNIRSDPSQIHTFKTIWKEGSPRNPWASLVVPVTPFLESLARQMIATPERYLPKVPAWTPTNGEQQVFYQNWRQGQQNSVRAEGIRALQYFRSRKNIRLIEPFLSDPAFLMNHYVATDETKREYYLRKAAFETLQKWNVAVERPVLEEVTIPGSSE